MESEKFACHVHRLSAMGRQLGSRTAHSLHSWQAIHTPPDQVDGAWMECGMTAPLRSLHILMETVGVFPRTV